MLTIATANGRWARVAPFGSLLVMCLDAKFAYKECVRRESKLQGVQQKLLTMMRHKIFRNWLYQNSVAKNEF